MTKTCRSCKSRKIGTGNPGRGMYAETAEFARSVELCRPCATEAGWENMHNDDGHDGIKNGGADPSEFGGQENLDGVLTAMKQCWICVPELNKAGMAPATERAGASRAGMRLTVSIRAAGRTKAEQVKAQLPEGFKVTVRAEKGTTVLRAKGPVNIVLSWDQRGAYAGGTVQATNGTARKVRNASEALRYAGV